MHFAGIDPGLDGGISIIKEIKGKIVFKLYDIPTIAEKIGKKIRRRYNLTALVNLFKNIPAGDCFTLIEKSIAMPGQSSIGMASMWLGQGLYQGILASHYIKFERIYSKRWQKEFSIAGDTKSQAFQVASRLFPNAELTTPRGRIITGRCDSLLIAEYARRKYKNELVV